MVEHFNNDMQFMPDKGKLRFLRWQIWWPLSVQNRQLCFLVLFQ